MATGGQGVTLTALGVVSRSTHHATFRSRRNTSQRTPSAGTSWDTVRKGEIPAKGEDDPDRVARVGGQAGVPSDARSEILSDVVGQVRSRLTRIGVVRSGNLRAIVRQQIDRNIRAARRTEVGLTLQEVDRILVP